MFFAIFSLAFLICAGLAFLFGVLKGRRKRWQVSLSRIILTIASALISTALSLIVCWVVLKSIFESLILGGALGEFSGLFNEVPSMQVAVLAIVSMIVAPLLFLIFFAIVRPIASCFTKLLARCMTKKKHKELTECKKNGKPDKNACLKLPKANVTSVLLGGFSGLLLLCVLLVPIVGFTGVVADIGSAAVMAATDEGETVTEALDALDTNVGSVTVKLLGGGLLYDLMTSYPTENGMATLRHEGEFVGAAATAVVNLSDKDAQKQEQIDSLKKTSEEFDDSTLLPSTLAELISAASESWKNDDDFHGIECPELGNDDLQPIVTSLIDGFSHSTADTIKDDFSTVIDVLCAFVEYDVIEKIGDDPLAILSNEECTSEILLALLNNPHFEVTVEGISDFGISMMMESIGAHSTKDGLYDSMMQELSAVSGADTDEIRGEYADIFDSYGIEVDDDKLDELAQARLAQTRLAVTQCSYSDSPISSVIASADDFNQKTRLISTDMITGGKPTIVNKENEAKSLADAYAVLYTMLGELDGDEFNINAIIGDLGAALNAFANTQTIGEKGTEYILTAMLQSKTVRDSIGHSLLSATDTAQAIIDGANEEENKYEAVCASLKKAMDVVTMASGDSENLEAMVNELLNDLTPATANIMKTMATPEFMIKQGVSEESAEPTSSMVSNTFANLADAKKNGMSDEEYQREAAAVNDMMTILMETDNANGDKPTFGDDSTTGKSAQELVDNVMNSKVMSKTVVDEVYGDGDVAKSDPLNSNRRLNNSEKNEFIDAVNNSWQENSDDPDAEKKLTAIGAIVNVDIKLDGDTWVLA